MSRSLHLEEVPYCPDSCELFDVLRDLPGAALLDSSFPHSRRGRFDILVALPLEEPPPTFAGSPGEARDFFAAMQAYQQSLFGEVRPVHPDLPFCGGIVGYLNYDVGNNLEDVLPPQPCNFRQTTLRAYDCCLVQDHLMRRAVMVSLPGASPDKRQTLLRRLADRSSVSRTPFHLHHRFKTNLDEGAYREAFEQIQRYIHAGDCYQVNLARRFLATYEGDPWLAYRALRGVAAAPFSAFIAEPDGAVMSLSPERFLSLHGQHVETSPIKGTRPRYSDKATDELAARELRNSAKDRAENLMIVDLLRNDLGRSCVPGSIHVDRLFELQSFPTVHHLVSTISGELSSGRGAWELLRDSFPGGSITGAPKRRAMEIIAELEPANRQVYCGSIFYVSADGRMDSNIAIRTLHCQDNTISCWGGGGIVADSQWQREYQETYDKVGRFLDLLQTRFMA